MRHKIAKHATFCVYFGAIKKVKQNFLCKKTLNRVTRYLKLIFKRVKKNELTLPKSFEWFDKKK